MQKNREKRGQEKIFHFSLQGALPPGHALVLNLEFGTLFYLECWDSTQPRLVQQQQLTRTEISVLLPLLEFFPYYCPYEFLYASFYGDGQVNEANTADARRHLQEAEQDGMWHQEMRPVRCALSRTRQKVRSFGIDISSLLATGYMLVMTRHDEGGVHYGS
jgi:hypothetical protein